MFENKIRELGGPDYKKAAYKLMENEGEELPGYEGYKYFGAAKDLPGVRELFQKKTPEAPQKNLVEVYRGIDLETYFG
jgi:pre-mRNA-splicing factor ISY1